MTLEKLYKKADRIEMLYEYGMISKPLFLHKMKHIKKWELKLLGDKK